MLTLTLHGVLLAAVLGVGSGGGPSSPNAPGTPVPVIQYPGVVLSSTGSSAALALRETAGPDTFALYGGPDNLTEGKFQDITGTIPDWGGWTSHDTTKQPPFWHVSTFSAENLNNNGPGNLAMWCGQDAVQAPGWVDAPGYGNNWGDWLIYESDPVADPSVGQVVSLDFWFNHDTEPGYDYFRVEYDSAGSWVETYSVSSYNADQQGNWGQPYTGPGIQYSAVANRQIDFTGNDYGGDANDQIRFRLGVTSDGAWSDEDGLWPTPFGAAQVDDISITHSGGSFSEDFEGAGPYLMSPAVVPFAGDFADLYARLSDSDPCRDNDTPVVGFIDYGQEVRNGPGADGSTSTGGSTSAGVSYGISGAYVVNYNGGLSNGLVPLNNEIWSPDILWDLPGPDDDGIEVSGAFIRFTVWEDLLVTNGIFRFWSVASALPGQEYTNWEDRNFVYYNGGSPSWNQIIEPVTDLLQQGPERVRLRLGAVDFAAVFGFPGTAATPSPVFDNVAFYKYRIGGPSITTREIDLANDGFPVSGSIDVSTQASRDALDISFDMARDVNSGKLVNTPGDSLVFDVVAVIPGTSVADIRMKWALDRNPVFEDAIRTAPGRPVDEFVVSGPGVWTGEVVASVSTTSAGTAVTDRYYVDVPDVDFLYPGDVLHYYFQATDSDGRVTTLPNDLTGFGTFDGSYNRSFIVRGLPSVTDTAGSQPTVLVYNDFGHRGVENDFIHSFQEIGYIEGVDYDTYTVQGPTSGVSNGLGSPGAHGATAQQLAGYNAIFYLAGDLTSFTLSNGDPLTNGNEKSDDLFLLEQWHALPGSRSMAYFGDAISSTVSSGSADGLAYLQNTMGVNLVDANIFDAINGTLTPNVRPMDPAFVQEYHAFFVCLARPVLGYYQTVNPHDQILPLGTAYAGHGYVDPVTDQIIATAAASVVHPNPVPGVGGYDVTFPYSLMWIYDNPQRASVGLASRTVVFQELLTLFNEPATGGSPATAAPSRKALKLVLDRNPFNPSTVIEFNAPAGVRGSVRVYSLRGELVRTLHDGEFRTDRFRWDGTDSKGASVASGVYLVRAEAAGEVRVAKAALVK